MSERIRGSYDDAIYKLTYTFESTASKVRYLTDKLENVAEGKYDDKEDHERSQHCRRMVARFSILPNAQTHQ